MPKTTVSAVKSDSMLNWPDVQSCECGSPMRFVSIELGYSCINTECEFHIAEELEVA